MTHSPTDWVFVTLRPGVHVVLDVEVRPDAEFLILFESREFDDNGIEIELGASQ